jgi:phosphoglycolate phosphatase-like HAD superfamily hydrolase
MTGPTLLVLDFDGVICDSVDEAFLASWTAYHGLYRKDEPTAVPVTLHRDFARLRPFIRTGEDFVLIQDLLATGKTVENQEQFDEALRRMGDATRDSFKEIFYQARTRLLETERTLWLSLNRIYPHVDKALRMMAGWKDFVILSTKKPQFINEVLVFHGLTVPQERILYSDREPKLMVTERVRNEGGYTTAILVEDQIDHIRDNVNPRVGVRLATWGYVKPEWLVAPAAVPLVTPEEFVALVERLLAER